MVSEGRGSLRLPIAARCRDYAQAGRLQGSPADADALRFNWLDCAAVPARALSGSPYPIAAGTLSLSAGASVTVEAFPSPAPS